MKRNVFSLTIVLGVLFSLFSARVLAEDSQHGSSPGSEDPNPVVQTYHLTALTAAPAGVFPGCQETPSGLVIIMTVVADQVAESESAPEDEMISCDHLAGMDSPDADSLAPTLFVYPFEADPSKGDTPCAVITAAGCTPVPGSSLSAFPIVWRERSETDASA